MTDVHAVIFDLDGTLLDTLADIAAAANEVIVSQGAKALPVDTYRDLVGDGVVMLFARALGTNSVEDPRIPDCVVEFKHAYGRNWNQQTKPYDGIVELLAILQEHKIVTAVLSNKPHEFTQQCIREYLGHHPFDFIFGQRENVPPKPDPAGAYEIVNQAGVSQEQCVYVGDTCTDMQTACAAGMLPVGVSWGFRPVQELVEHGARHMIDHPLQLLELLGIPSSI
ncbi:MAG: HAD family hydrolase [Pirellulaceae bacterium]|nr:HAD family hydrolase [Pirellulaceae bacterium]